MNSRYELLHTLSHLWAHPRASRDRVSAFRERKLRCLVRHASANVRYYRDLFARAGIAPGDIRTVDDLRRIPVTGKRDLRERAPEDILAEGAREDRLLRFWTSGSSGRPLVVRRAQLEDLVVRSFNIRILREFGLRLRDKHAMVAVGTFPGERRKTPVARLWEASRIYRRHPVQCLQPAGDILRELERYDPDFIIGYASVLAHVAPLAGGRPPGGALRFVIAGGESLSPARRSAIERGFGVRVFDVFGAHECCIVASECPQTGLYHVCDDNAIVEVLRDGRPAAEGEAGEVVVTALHCYAMPFIRYCLGDIVVRGPETCPCGQPFSTLESIKGRMRDYFSLPDGRRVHALEAIMPVFDEDASWIYQYQLTQETEDRFLLRVVPLGDPDPARMEAVRKAVASRLGPGARLDMELSDNIPFEPSGKFKDCRSLVEPGPD